MITNDSIPLLNKIADGTNTFVCADCKQWKPIQKNGGTGYAIINDCNLKVCYDCVAIRDKKEMEETGKFVGYLTRGDDNKWYFANWPGTLKIPGYVTTKNVYCFGHRTSRSDIWFYYNGFQWWGVNIGDNQICRAKRTKKQIK